METSRTACIAAAVLGGRVQQPSRVEETPRRNGRRRPKPVLPAPAAPRKRRGWGRPIGIVVLVLLLVVVVWAVASYVALGRAVDGANARLGPTPLDQQSGLILNEPTTTLLLGTDHGPGAGRESARRTDSMLLMRTDPERGRVVLSLPRDLRVEVPGRVLEAQRGLPVGGPDLTIRTVRNLLGNGVAIHHVVVVDFDDFERLIDALGGVTIDVPEPIVSNRFDCPYLWLRALGTAGASPPGSRR